MNETSENSSYGYVWLQLCRHSLFIFIKLLRINSNQGIGNGIPLGAVVTTPEIAKVLTNRSYFNTFGGNPVCTAGGLAVLRVIEKEKLQQNAFSVGSYLKNRLTSLMEKHESMFLLPTLRMNKDSIVFCYGHKPSNCKQGQNLLIYWLSFISKTWFFILQLLVMWGEEVWCLALSWLLIDSQKLQLRWKYCE